jgi:hypothetical protein
MEPKAVRPDALEAMVETLKSNYRNLMVTYNSSWRTDDREPARQALAQSVRDAQQAIQSVEGTSDPELRRWHHALLIEATLAEDAVRNPHTLKR